MFKYGLCVGTLTDYFWAPFLPTMSISIPMSNSVLMSGSNLNAISISDSISTLSVCDLEKEFDLEIELYLFRFLQDARSRCRCLFAFAFELGEHLGLIFRCRSRECFRFDLDSSCPRARPSTTHVVKSGRAFEAQGCTSNS